jgi:hypothetical protein
MTSETEKIITNRQVAYTYLVHAFEKIIRTFIPTTTSGQTEVYQTALVRRYSR